MPIQDRNGPLGEGPLTGRGLGICGNNFIPRRKLRNGFRRGLGGRFRNRFFPSTNQIPSENENELLRSKLEVLDREENFLKSERELINNRLKHINND